MERQREEIRQGIREKVRNTLELISFCQKQGDKSSSFGEENRIDQIQREFQGKRKTSRLSLFLSRNEMNMQ